MNKMKFAIFIIMICSSCLLLSCTNTKNTEETKAVDVREVVKTVEVYKDSIIYQLKPDTEKKLAKVIVKNNNITRCIVSFEGVDNAYYFTFPYNNLSKLTKQDSILFARTNRFLKLKEKYYQIVFLADYDFFKEGKEPTYTICGNNYDYVFVQIRKNGELKRLCDFPAGIQIEN